MRNQTSRIISSSLTEVWKAALESIVNQPGSDVSMLCVTMEGFRGRLPDEDPPRRARIDHFLVQHGLRLVQTTANTIFPSSLWNECRPRYELYRRYAAIFPRLRKRPENRYGLYFERMIAFGRRPNCDDLAQGINQLEKIIDFRLSGNTRRSALQLSVYDPSKDLVNQRQRGFPCLQQVSFHPLGKDHWSITGYYPHQYILDRGYGNYLGLARLGDFVAHSLGGKLTQVNCIADIAEIGNVTKAEAAQLLREL